MPTTDPKHPSTTETHAEAIHLTQLTEGAFMPANTVIRPSTVPPPPVSEVRLTTLPVTLSVAHDDDALIVAAAAGDAAAKLALQPLILARVRALVVTAGEVRRVAESVAKALGNYRAGFGRPRPGNARHWLESVIRELAARDFEEAQEERSEEWDPPEELDPDREEATEDDD